MKTMINFLDRLYATILYGRVTKCIAFCDSSDFDMINEFRSVALRSKSSVPFRIVTDVEVIITNGEEIRGTKPGRVIFVYTRTRGFTTVQMEFKPVLT